MSAQPRRAAKALCLLPMAAILCASGIAYWNSLTAPFQFDDEVQIVTNQALLAAGSAADVFRAYPTRALGFLSLAVNSRLHGLWAPGFHLVNIAIHMMVITFVFLLAKTLLRWNRRDETQGDDLQVLAIAAVAAGIFALHPIQTQAVTYIVQRLASMTALFYVASLYFFTRTWISPKLGWKLASFICGAAAMFCKQNAITLPFSLLALDLLFGPANTIESTKQRALRLAPYLSLLAVIPLTMMTFGDFESQTLGVNTDPVPPVKDYWLTQLAAIPFYLGLVALPLEQSLDHDFPLRTQVDAGVLIGCGVLLAVALFAYRWRHRNPVVAFGLLLAVIASAVESIVPLPDLTFEHRLYLPMAGMAIAFAKLLFDVAGQRAAVVCGVLLLALYGTLTYRRNIVWQSGISLWSDVALKAPNKARGHINLAKAVAVEANAYADAARHLETATTIAPTNVHAWVDLSRLRSHLGRHDEAILAAESAVAIDGNDKTAALRLITAFRQAGRCNDAMTAATSGKERWPEDQTISIVATDVASECGDATSAEQMAKTLIETRPEERAGYLALARARARQGDYEGAFSTLNAVATSASDHANEAWIGLEVAALARDRGRAEKFLPAALQSQEVDLAKHLRIGDALIKADLADLAHPILQRAMGLCERERPACPQRESIMLLARTSGLP